MVSANDVMRIYFFSREFASLTSSPSISVAKLSGAPAEAPACVVFDPSS